MGIFNAQKGKNFVNASTVISLSGLGKARAEESVANAPKDRIMSYISASGPSSVKEISDGTHIPIDMVELIVRKHMPVIFRINNDGD
jgi:hypothetical protein